MIREYPAMDNPLAASFDFPGGRRGVLLRLARMAEHGLHKIKCPLLIVQPVLDSTVRQDSADIIFKGAVNAAHKEILRLENSRHVCPPQSIIPSPACPE